MTLQEHINLINIKSKAEMDANPNVWIGMVPDADFWRENYNITTVAQYERHNLETMVYELHKDAYGVKGRHYNFDAMSNEDLEKEADHLMEVAKQEYELEKKAEAKAYEKFENQVTENIKLGAGDRETAIKWILEAEELDKEGDTGYICYCLGLGYDKEYIFKPYTMKEAV